MDIFYNIFILWVFIFSCIKSIIFCYSKYKNRNGNNLLNINNNNNHINNSNHVRFTNDVEEVNNILRQYKKEKEIFDKSKKKGHPLTSIFKD